MKKSKYLCIYIEYNNFKRDFFNNIKKPIKKIWCIKKPQLSLISSLLNGTF